MAAGVTLPTDTDYWYPRLPTTTTTKRLKSQITGN